jgi:transcriptional regulator with PAS, ATPase and Fis domain
MSTLSTSNVTTLEVGESERLQSLTAQVSLVLRWAEGVRVVVLEPNRPVTIGRSGESAVVIPERTLSRQHAKLWSSNQQVFVEDCGSRNGVWLRGQRVHKATLKAGEWLALGEVVVSAHLTGGESLAMIQRTGAAPRDPNASLLWEGEGMAALELMLERAAKAALPVLILGETGTGKELLAHEIHRRSVRSARAMQIVNCAALPSALVESALFGHERGAFTGAERAHVGAFELANGSTVFLDEIGELPPDAQSSLLRVLDTGRFSRVGSSRETEVDVRVLAATHRDLDAMVASGTFRLDLLHRLDVISVRMPALRDRPTAIDALLNCYLERSADHGTAKQFSDRALAALQAYAWPGNVRELRNLVERSVAMIDRETIELEDLPDRMRCESALRAISLRACTSERERSVLVAALERYASRKEVAEALQLSMRTLERRIQKHKLGRARS